MDWHEQVQGLVDRTDKACYPDLNKSLMELELENFSKQVVASLNTVLRQSPQVQRPILGDHLHTIVSHGDPSKSTLSQHSSILGHPQIS